MNKPLRIGLAAKYMDWGGGIFILRLLTHGLLAVSSNRKLQLCLLIPSKKKAWWQRQSAKMAHVFAKEIEDENLPVEIVTYTDTQKGLIKVINKKRIDIILPIVDSLGKDFPRPWIGYIYDLQHRDLPKLFSPDIKKHRDIQFQHLLAESRALVVNSKQVRLDLSRYYPDSQSRVISLPFSPFPLTSWLKPTSNEEVEQYDLPKDYFLISDQFWVHKDHLTAWRALAKLLKKKPDTNITLVCTGKTEDSRDPQHFQNLMHEAEHLGIRRSLRILGYIPKQHQMEIMKHAKAVIQPTTYEGGPGGGAAYEAVALGKTLILSDIPINKEVKGKDIHFFDSGSPDSLAEKMLELLKQSGNRTTSQSDLIARGKVKLKLLGQILMETIDWTVTQYQ